MRALYIDEHITADEEEYIRIYERKWEKGNKRAREKGEKESKEPRYGEGRVATMAMGESHAMGRSGLKIEMHGTAAETAGVPTGRYSITRYVVCIAMGYRGARLSRSLVSLPKEHSSKMKPLLEYSPAHLRAEKSPRSPFSFVGLIITRR